jgi:hypothetical protein
MENPAMNAHASRTRWLALPLTVLLSACSVLDPSASAPASTFPVLLTVQRDGATPVPGVQVLEGGHVIGTTDATGSVALELSGVEGGSASLALKCPEGFASPQKTLDVGLRHLAPGSPPPRFNSECVPLVHSIVAAVLAENGPNLPITFLNQVLGHTNELGVGHVLLEASEHQQITLTLDTRAQPHVLPQNPALTFVAPEHDALVLLEQDFTVKKAKARARGPSRPRPTRISL